MAALKEARSYGLSCGRVSDGSRVSVFHVKLTDSALKAFESYRAHQDSVSLRPSIRFEGSQGHISIPQPDCPEEVRAFSFYLSNIGRDSPQGSFDCIQQYVSSHGDVHLDCLGSIQDKVTVCATDDSYQKARQSMAQAEEETRSRSAIVIKAGGRYMGKKVQFRKPAPGTADAVPSRKRATPINLASAIRKSGGSGASSVVLRPFRDRVLHLLALRPYRKAELLLRLQKDGLTQADKETLDSLLQQVASVNPKDGTCTLRDCMYKDVQKDWPGYSEGDQQLLKRVLMRKLCQPQSANSDSTASSPPREHGRSASPSQSERPAGSSHTHSRPKKKSKKHKDKERPPEDRPPAPQPDAPALLPDTPGLNGACASVPTSTSETTDYLLKYPAISSSEQRQSYKNDFNAEYSEYRSLHARIEQITRRFTQLDAQLRQLSQGSEEYETTRGQILQEYRKIKKTNTNYSREKRRCEYLHRKLAHIKRLIAEYDQRQLQAWP
ncbi:RNA polymerase II elongation factor ELL isoform X2 [Alexandromys fortis]|uniref:RNA polymerase II elongation factor ELL isoform X2 n=1 Tax=Alexandromys fortis TaxID=100897 RepID=UPI0021536D6F|nr:RNA polymerase II elongation factor ELL isoform X2 [Microtus fortis]